MVAAKKKLWVAFDVETARLNYEVAGGWENPSGFGFTVGSTMDNTGDVRVFRADKEGETSAREALVAYLLQYDRIVSFNGVRFDHGVIAAGNDIIQAQLDERAWDMKLLLEKAIGVDDARGPHIISLNGVANATVSASKSLEDGREAVRLWRKGRCDEVAEYNVNDTKITAAVWEFALRNGYVLFEPARIPIMMMGTNIGPSNYDGSPRHGLLVVKVSVDWKR